MGTHFQCADRPSIGLAWSTGVSPQMLLEPDLIDHLEISFEQIAKSPKVLELKRSRPIILHCASLSMAGFVEPSEDTIAHVLKAVADTETPWLGEHLAFISAVPGDETTEPVNIGFTMSPQLNDQTLERVSQNIQSVRSKLNVPLLLENPPQYFLMPGSTMNMPEFIAAMCGRNQVGLLIDLTHLFIAAENIGWNAFEALQLWPLERVVEVHISGASQAEGKWWDNHAAAAPEPVFDLLAFLLKRSRPRAITLEYNWAPDIPVSFMHEQVSRIRASL